MYNSEFSQMPNHVITIIEIWNSSTTSQNSLVLPLFIICCDKKIILFFKNYCLNVPCIQKKICGVPAVAQCIQNSTAGSSRGTAETNPTSMRKNADLIPGLTLALP